LFFLEDLLLEEKPSTLFLHQNCKKLIKKIKKNFKIKISPIFQSTESDSNSDLDGFIVDYFTESEEDSSKSIHKTKIETKKKKLVISKDSDESETNSDCFILDDFIESENESAKSDSENVALSADSDFRFNDFEWCFEENIFPNYFFPSTSSNSP
jgi:hypothetical protein